MPDTAGYGNRGSKALYFSVTNGKFKFRTSKNADYEFVDEIWGNYAGCTVRWKDGGDQFEGHDSFLITILGADENGESISLKIDAFFPSTWAKMFIAYLEAIEPGEKISVSTWSSGEGSKVSFCKVESLKTGIALPIKRRLDAPKIDKDALAEAQKGLDEKGKIRVKKEFQDRTSIEIEKWCQAILDTHPAFVPAEKAEEEGEEEGEGKPGGGSTTNSDAAGSGSGGTAATGAGRQTHSHVPEGGTGSATKHISFGYEARVWPQPEFWQAAATPKQLEIYPPKAIEVFGDELTARLVGTKILKGFGLERTAFDLWSKAHYGLILEFMLHAPAESIAAAKLAANPGSGVESPFDGSDPYA